MGTAEDLYGLSLYPVNEPSYQSLIEFSWQLISFVILVPCYIN